MRDYGQTHSGRLIKNVIRGTNAYVPTHCAVNGLLLVQTIILTPLFPPDVMANGHYISVSRKAAIGVKPFPDTRASENCFFKTKLYGICLTLSLHENLILLLNRSQIMSDLQGKS